MAGLTLEEAFVAQAGNLSFLAGFMVAQQHLLKLLALTHHDPEALQRAWDVSKESAIERQLCQPGNGDQTAFRNGFTAVFASVEQSLALRRAAGEE